MLWRLLLLFRHVVVARLVVRSMAELQVGGQYDWARLLAEADLVQEWEQDREGDQPGCQVREKVELYEVISLSEEGGEVVNKVQVVQTIDSVVSAMKVVNAVEPWIVGEVSIR